MYYGVPITKVEAFVLGKDRWMFMMIGNNMGIGSAIGNAAKVGGYKNVRDYSNYLMGKYSCLKPGNKVAVSLTSGLLRKAMSDEKTGQWLERELSKAPDYIKEAQQSASARGSKLIYASFISLLLFVINFVCFPKLSPYYTIKPTAITFHTP